MSPPLNQIAGAGVLAVDQVRILAGQGNLPERPRRATLRERGGLMGEERKTGPSVKTVPAGDDRERLVKSEKALGLTDGTGLSR